MRLKITSFGQSAEGIELTGNPKKMEPDHVRIAFPGGDVEVVRSTDGKNPDYWVHVRINHPQGGMFVPDEDRIGKLSDTRLDILEKHSSEVNVGDFNDPGLYHVAFKIKPKWD
jgi:hypothetical protein